MRVSERDFPFLDKSCWVPELVLSETLHTRADRPSVKLRADVAWRQASDLCKDRTSAIRKIVIGKSATRTLLMCRVKIAPQSNAPNKIQSRSTMLGYREAIRKPVAAKNTVMIMLSVSEPTQCANA